MEVPGFKSRLRVRPGIAGLAQVRGRYSTRPRNKLRYDDLYIDNMGLILDIKLLLMSLVVSILGHSPRDTLPR